MIEEDASVITEEMQEAAKASAKAATKKRNEEPNTKLRRKGQGPGAGELIDSDIPYPVEAHGEDFEFYGTQGFGATIPDGVDIAPYSIDQEFVLDPDRVKVLKFTEAGRNLPKKRLYTVKAIHKDGRLVQLPFELQIQNNAGGDTADAIGLRRYQRKGITILIDWETLTPIYCAAWDCWARAANTGRFRGFCTERHARHTMPNSYKNAGEITQGLLEVGVTTSRTWMS